MTDVMDVCNQIIRFQKEDEVDFYAEKQLKTALYNFRAVKRPLLAETRYIVNGQKRLSLLEAMMEFEDLKTLEIHFFKPNMRENWDYDMPTKKIVLIGHGLGGVETFNYNPLKLNKWDVGGGVNRHKVMVRGFFSEYYYPLSIKTKTLVDQDPTKRIFIPQLRMLEVLWKIVREKGIVPFAIHVCLYTQTERFTYNIDLVNNRLIRDFRGGAISVKEKAVRTSMDNFNFDRILASTDMKEKVKQVFITLYDMKKATAFDIAHSFGMTESMGKNCLDAIVSRGFATKEGTAPREIYEINSVNLENAEDFNTYKV